MSNFPEVRILSAEECERAVDASALIDEIARGFVEYSAGRVAVPPVGHLGFDDPPGDLHVKYGHVRGDDVFVIKAATGFPRNVERGLPTGDGAMLVLDARTGLLRAILLDHARLTDLRTAAAGAVAARALARRDVRCVGVLGAGVQARSHVEAMSHVRRIRRCRVVSRNTEHARKLADELSESYAFAVEAVETIEDALRGADLIVTATNAKDAVVRRALSADGAHINAVGSCTPHTRELDAETVAASSMFVDSVESTVNEAGDYIRALKEGAVGPEHIRAELGEVLNGAKPGRTSSEEITLFKSLGLAVEDLAAAEYLYRKSKETGAGTWVKF